MGILKFLLLSIFALQLILPSSVLAEKVVLDVHSDQTKNWLEVTCLYNDDYKDFWVYGYPVTLSGDEDVFPVQSGFWTAGLAQRCEMHYFLGGGMPLAKSITIGMYLKGKPQVLLASKYSILDEEYTTEIGSISEKDGTSWIEKTFNLTDRAMVFNFTLISMADDLLLLDKIEFDFGDDTTVPTEPPPTTTSRPIEDDTVTLDTDKDYWVLWEVDCNYVEDFTYFWAYGCPDVSPKEDDTQIGYWTSCSTNYASCNLGFTADASIISEVPDSITIRSYVEGNARINVTARDHQNPECNGDDGCSVVGVIGDTQGKWSEVTIPINVSLSVVNYRISIEMIPSENGLVLLENVKVRLPENSATIPTTISDDGTTSSDDGVTSSDEVTTSDGVTSSDGGVASTESGPTSSTTKKSSAVMPKLDWHVATFILVMATAAVNLMHH